MERIQSINPDRIIWCCTDFGISPAELATELGIATATFDRAMAGESVFTFNQLKKIADYFDRGVLFYLEAGPVDELQMHTPAFRTLANQKPDLTTKLKSLIERVERQKDVYLSLLEDLNEADRPVFDPPNLSGKDSGNAARIAREWLRLTEYNNFESYRAAVEARGILVFRSNGYSGKWQISKDNPMLGFTLYDVTCPVIVIKKQSSTTRQTFTLMHELGHLLMHKSSSIDDENDLFSHQGRERDANAFAGYLLVPNVFLANIKDAERPDDISRYDEWLESYRKAWGVSGEVILRRLLEVGRLKQNQYVAYRQWRSQLVEIAKDGGNRMYRYREPKHVFGDTFVKTVLDSLNARHITLAKASSYLDNLKIKDLHQLERFYAGI